MVSVDFMAQRCNLVLEHGRQHISVPNLSFSSDIDEFLDTSCAMHSHAKFNKSRLNCVDNLGKLVISRNFNQFLSEIITEGVPH